MRKCSFKNKRILITCGPTWVPIDSMRVISNQSTGAMGQTIANACAQAGAKVTLLEGPVVKPLESKSIRIIKFTFFDEFARLIKKELAKNYAICIHAAAVSDYTVKNRQRTKLSSSLKNLKLDLAPTEKIIYSIKKINPKVFLVGFKLESRITKISARNKTKKLFEQGKCDLVVANSLSSNKYSGYIIDKDRNILNHCTTRTSISKALVQVLNADH